ncbi:MAG: alpha/beta fold hydrolase [Candidatus Methylomirabilales bacterium]
MKKTKGEINEGRFTVPYRIYGDAEKSIVCVSGAQQTMAIWRSFVLHFSRDYRVVVFDPPGQGHARILSGPTAISLDEQVEVLRKIVFATHRDDPVILAAASWGTIVAAGFTARYPGMVRKLLLGSFGIKPNKKMLDIIKEGQTLHEQKRGHQIAQLIVENFGHRLNDTYKNRILDQFLRMDQEQFGSFYAMSELIENARDINDHVPLHNITAQTLVINGEYDDIIDLEDADIVATRIPDCEVRIVQGAGHFLHHERERDDILQMYGEFFSR